MSTLEHATGAGAMDRIYRHQRYIYNLTRRYYLIGRDEMIRALNPPSGGSVLEVGCGTARNLIKVANHYRNVELYGLDISSEMLKTAARSVAANGHAGRIRLAAADAKNFDPQTLFGIESFDRIFISYSLSMIPGYADVIEGAIRHLAPGGTLHIVDFGRMDTMPSHARRAMLAWLDRFSVTPRRDLEEVVARIATANGMTASFREGRFGYAVHASLARGQT